MKRGIPTKEKISLALILLANVARAVTLNDEENDWDRPLLKPYDLTAAPEVDEPDYDDFRESEFSVESQYFDSPAMHSDVRVGMRPSRDLTTCTVPWKCDRPCPFGYFRLSGMGECRKWLTCADWADLDTNRTYLTQGSMKRVFKTNWNGTPLILARVKRFKYTSFIANLKSLQPSIFVTQLVGSCEDPAWPEVLLEYHPHGRLGNLPDVLEMSPQLAQPHLLMRLLLDYASILSVLHHMEPEGARVLCDTWSLQKITHQFLLTKDFRLLLNDVDDLSVVMPSQNKLAKCSAGFYQNVKLLDSEFLAPEEFSQGFFDESVDIYKVPSLAQWILEWAGEDGRELLLLLDPLHRRCKSVLPKDRPSALEILSEYQKVYEVALNRDEEDERSDLPHQHL